MASKFSVVGSIRDRVPQVAPASSDKQRLRFTPAVLTLSSQVLIVCRERSVADEVVEKEEGEGVEDEVDDWREIICEVVGIP